MCEVNPILVEIAIRYAEATDRVDKMVAAIDNGKPWQDAMCIARKEARRLGFTAIDQELRLAVVRASVYGDRAQA